MNMKKRYHVIAFLYDRKGRLISTGENSYIKTHTIQAKYSRDAGSPSKIFLHAEMDALLKSRHSGLKPHKVVVARYLQNGEPAMAKPCPACQKALEDFGVEEIEWTISENYNKRKWKTK